MTTPARILVEAFGNLEELEKLYAPDIKWWLPRSMVPEVLDGKDAVLAFNRYCWTDLYKPDCHVEILDEVGNESISAVRFIYRAFMIPVNRDYENHYTLFAKKGPSGIFEVHEAMDSAATAEFMGGQEPGSIFKALS